MTHIEDINFKAYKAMKPFYDCVFNDNGDITLTRMHINDKYFADIHKIYNEYVCHPEIANNERAKNIFAVIEPFSNAYSESGLCNLKMQVMDYARLHRLYKKITREIEDLVKSEMMRAYILVRGIPSDENKNKLISNYDIADTIVERISYQTKEEILEFMNQNKDYQRTLLLSSEILRAFLLVRRWAHPSGDAMVKNDLSEADNIISRIFDLTPEELYSKLEEISNENRSAN